MSPDRALVTGGAGFIGSALCRELLRAGHEVLVFDDLSFGRRELVQDGPACTFERGDVRDAAHVARVVQRFRPRLVFHLAALHFIPYCNAHPVETVEVNVGGTRNLLGACRATPPECVFFASTAAVYPLERSPFAEDHPIGPVDVYGETKLIGEELARLFHLETRVGVRACRFFNAFGPNETNPHLIPEVARQLAGPGPHVLRLGNLDPVRDYVHTSDLVAALLALASSGREGYAVYNIGSGRGVSVREVVSAFQAAVGGALAVEQEAARVRKVERLELVADITRIGRDTGWLPRVDFAEGIRRLVASAPPHDAHSTVDR